MDRIAIISDVHGNLPALEAVLEDIRSRGIDTIYNLGDLVGSGPQPAEVVDVCRSACALMVRGNWDDIVGSQQEDVWEVTRWHRRQIGPERRAYLAGLPFAHDFWWSGLRVRLFHASPDDLYRHVYPHDVNTTLTTMFANSPATGMDVPTPDIVGYGDIHSPFVLSLDVEHKTLFNVGSVGLPVDRPLAAYAVMTGCADSRDARAFAIDIVRVPYDIERTAAAARRVGLPDCDAYCNELRLGVYRARHLAARRRQS